MSTYCDFVQTRPETDVHRHYHDHDYGFPLHDDNALFERLVLEINQAGLSWETILKKKENFQRAYGGFDVDGVAAYTEADRERLLSDAGIIRNKLKVNAAIENAQRIVALRKDYGSFKGWLDAHHPLTKDEWVKVFKKQFVFVGGEIVNETLMSTGYLPGAHAETCPTFAKIAKLNPPWMQAVNKR
jgi:DNA-3-methyladenine glycosylase I